MRRKIAAFIIGVFLVGCGGETNLTPLPDAIQGMKLQETLQDGRADSVITQLHGKTVTAAQNFIGRYRSSHYSGTLYLTIYPDSVRAINALNAMAARIQDPQIGGQMGFIHVRELPKYGPHVYITLRKQRAHFFFVEGNTLYWLDINPAIAMNAIQEFTD